MADAPSFATALRRADPLAWGGLAAAAVLVAFPVYYAVATLGPLFGGSAGHAADFAVYVRGGRRLLADPAHLYDEPGFLYPPPAAVPFALASRLPLAWGYVASGVLTVAALVACLRLVERMLPERPAGWARAAWWATGLALAPALQNVKFGQVNVFVLLAALVFVRAVSDPAARRRALAVGGGALALGAWLKVYPLALAALALRRRTWPALAGLAAGLVAVPLAALPLVPLSLYRVFATDVAPRVAGESTPALLNVGLPVIVERLRLPAASLLSNASAPIGPAAAAAATLTLAVGIAAALAAWHRGWPTPRAAFAVLAVLPAASTFGWEYTFALALPAVLALVAAARRRPLAVRLVALATVCVWLVQKPPESAVAWAVRTLGEGPVEGFAARFVVSLAALAACVGWTRAAEPPADETPAA